MSIDSLCKSLRRVGKLANFVNSSIIDTQTDSSPSSEIQIGIGVPKNLLRDTPQSLTFSNHNLNLPEPMKEGCHVTFSLFASKSSFKDVTLTK